MPIVGARARDAALMASPGRPRSRSSLFVAVAFAALTACYVASDFSVAQRVREFAFGEAADLQDHQRVGQPRRLDAAVGADPGAVRRAGRGLRRQSAGDAARPTCWRCSPGSRPPSICSSSLTSNPFLRLAEAPFEGRDLNPILQDLGLAIHPPLLYLGYVGFSISFSFADRRADRGPHRRRLGALGAAVDAGRLDVPHARHRDGLVLGLLRARLGRLVVLGSGRERLADAVARRHRAAAFGAW